MEFTVFSREAAQEYSPRRKPWVHVEKEQAPAGRKMSSHTVSKGQQRFSPRPYRRYRDAAAARGLMALSSWEYFSLT